MGLLFGSSTHPPMMPRAKKTGSSPGHRARETPASRSGHQELGRVRYGAFVDTTPPPGRNEGKNREARVGMVGVGGKGSRSIEFPVLSPSDSSGQHQTFAQSDRDVSSPMRMCTEATCQSWQKTQHSRVY